MANDNAANKGEWSELLVFVKVAYDAFIFMSDAKLQPIPDKRLKVDNIVRGDVIFRVSDPNTIFRSAPLDQEVQISKPQLAGKITHFTDEIIAASGAFKSQWGNNLLDEFHLSKVKADANKKADIDLTVSDPKTLLKSEAGFSIKSYLGNPSTLLNASRDNTNFQFRIEGFTGDSNTINQISGSSKIRDRITAIIEGGGRFVFSKSKGDVFNRNLMKIDSLMPSILGNLTLANCIVVKQGKKISDVVHSTELQRLNSNLPIDLGADLIAYKVKMLLLDIALGMVPTKVWDGRQTADGGYIVVKDTGDLVCFHVYNFGDFSDYLFDNTKFDTPSTTRHNFGFLYMEDGELFFDINCQIRFV
ncbi:HpaII family restriction endonuclease [Ahrensia kielensis]|uniref:HpaII family restriction endonuclease n=1 Tax=Ahrensia kielensis TaxID=76980 RepID=UPI00036B46CA|nr:HpaII family restriction endonuclease [Ahrensia kielensis]